MDKKAVTSGSCWVMPGAIQENRHRGWNGDLGLVSSLLGSKDLGSSSKWGTGLLVHICNSRTWGPEARGQPSLNREFPASVGYRMTPSLQKQKKQMKSPTANKQKGQ